MCDSSHIFVRMSLRQVRRREACRFFVAAVVAAAALATMELAACAAAPESGIRVVATWDEATAGENLARGARITLSERPHFPPEPERWRGRLNDGEIAFFDRSMWTTSAAVGWRELDHVVVTIVLGAIRAVRHVALRVLGGRPQAHLLYPRAVTAWLSEDGERWTAPAQALRERDFPAERGAARVANLVIPLQGRARFVALHFELGVNFLFLDEVAVIRGEVSGGAAAASSSLLQPLHRGVVAFPDKREWVISNPPLPTFLTILRDGSRAAPKELAAEIDVPNNVSLSGATRVGSIDDWPGHVRFRMRISHPHPSMAHVSRPLFLVASGPLPQGASIRIRPLVSGGRSLEFPLRAIEIPKVVAPRKLHVSLAWLQANLLPDWRELAPTLGSLGFNAIGAFPQYWPRERPPKIESDLISSARAAGMGIIYNESPFHVMEERHPGDERFRTRRRGGGAGPGVSPCYRGALYQEEITRIERLARVLRPQWVFFDTELWVPGTAEVDADQQCEAMRAHSVGGAALRAKLGAQIAGDLRRSLDRATPDGPRPRAGMYAVDPTHVYQGLFDFGSLFPDAMDLAMPSLYVGGDPLAVRDAIRSIRRREPRAFIVPWLTAGAQGELASGAIRSMVLEAFFNGARGITYYLAEDFDTPEDFRAHARAIALVAKHEEYFAGGSYVDSLPGANADISISGRAVGARRLILVGSYRSRQTESAQITTGCSDAIRDGETGAVLQSNAGTVRIALGPGESRVLECSSSAGTGAR